VEIIELKIFCVLTWPLSQALGKDGASNAARLTKPLARTEEPGTLIQMKPFLVVYFTSISQ
jgi:hypothetical protein